MKKITSYKILGYDLLIEIEIDDKLHICIIQKGIIMDLFNNYGWWFVVALWRALWVADEPNTVKIYSTWDELIKEYIVKFHNF